MVNKKSWTSRGCTGDQTRRGGGRKHSKCKTAHPLSSQSTSSHFKKPPFPSLHHLLIPLSSRSPLDNKLTAVENGFFSIWVLPISLYCDSGGCLEARGEELLRLKVGRRHLEEKEKGEVRGEHRK